MPRPSRDVVFVDGVRTPFGKAGGMYANTRADDLVIRCIRELLRRHPELPPERVDEVAVAATTQIGDQGLTIGRTAALLAGLPKTVPGFAIDRMCAGAMTAVTTVAGGIAMGAYDVAIAGGVEHMGRHPMGEGVDPNPRILAEKLVDPSALVMGSTAENLHDQLPNDHPRAGRPVRPGLASRRPKAAYEAGKLQPDLVTRRHPRPRERAGVWRRPTRRRGPTRPSRSWRRCAPRSGRTAGSRRATRPASTTARPPASWRPRTSRRSSACRSRCGWSATASSASSRR